MVLIDPSKGRKIPQQSVDSSRVAAWQHCLPTPVTIEDVKVTLEVGVNLPF